MAICAQNVTIQLIGRTIILITPVIQIVLAATPRPLATTAVNVQTVITPLIGVISHIPTPAIQNVQVVTSLQMDTGQDSVGIAIPALQIGTP